jgi:hypothetical protein
MKKPTLLLLILCLISPYIAHSQIIQNSGFEDSLSHWDCRLANGGNARFEITSIDTKEGALALIVAVTGIGSSDTAVRVVSSPVEFNISEMYLIRFWARSNKADARMRLDIVTEEATDYIDFRLRNGWYQYQYAFKAGETQGSIAFNFETFTTYGIDGIELLDQADETTDVPMTCIWQNSLGDWGWISGDNDPSVLLPDGRVAWIFNDSWLGTPDPHSNSLDVKGMYNNMIVVQEGENRDSLRTLYGGTMQNPTALLKPEASENWYWIADGIIEDNKLKVLLQNWEGGSDGWPVFRNRAAVAVLSLPDLFVETIVELSYTRSDIPNCILEGDGDYNYIYTVERITSFEWYTRVARVPKGELESTAEWEFYTDEDTWAAGDITPKRLTTVEPGSVVKLGTDKFALVGIPQLSNRIELWFATAPEGPWGNKITVHRIPNEPDVYAYLPHIHEETENNGVYTISHSVNTFDGIGHQIADKGTYIPYYVKVDMIKAFEGTFHPILTPYITYNGSTRECSGIAVEEGEFLYLSPQSTVEEGTWSWTGPNGFTYDSRRVTLGNIQVEQAGLYTVTFTDTHNNKDSLTMHIIVTEIETTSDSGSGQGAIITSYPNPVTDMLYIQGVDKQKFSHVELYNMTGEKVMQTERTEVDLRSLDQGVYLLQVSYRDEIFSRKVIKK